MSTKDTLESIARNTWLAGIGSIDNSKETLAKSIDAAQEKTNSLYSELLTRGEDIQSKINDTRNALQAKGRSILGMGNDKAQQEKIAELSAKVDSLTTAIVALIEKRNLAAKNAATKSTTTKKAPAKAKTAAKASVKTATKPKAPAKPRAAKTAAKPKTPAKASTKATASPKVMPKASQTNSNTGLDGKSE